MKLGVKAGLLAGAAVIAAVLIYRIADDSDPGGEPAFVRLVSGPAGGSWYPLGAKIAQVWGDGVPEIVTSNAPGGGVSNVMDVNAGNAEFGFAYGNSAHQGFNGLGKFRGKQENIRHFATLYPAAFQVAVRRDSPIRSYADLKDKNLSPGKAGWSGTVMSEAVLGAYGITFESIRAAGGTVHHVDYADSVALMKDGHIDVFLGVTAVPQSSFIALNFNPGIRFLEVDPPQMEQMLRENPGYIRTKIPLTAYEGLERDVNTLGLSTIMIVNKDVPDDVVYRMAKVFWESHALIAEVQSVWNGARLDDALAGTVVPVHPGAQRYYDEVGVIAK